MHGVMKYVKEKIMKFLIDKNVTRVFVKSVFGKNMEILPVNHRFEEIVETDLEEWKLRSMYKVLAFLSMSRKKIKKEISSGRDILTAQFNAKFALIQRDQYDEDTLQRIQGFWEKKVLSVLQK